MKEDIVLFYYVQAIKRAERLEELADRIEKAAVLNMDSTVGNLKKNWTGENAQSFYLKAGQIQSDLEEKANSIREIANSIRATADNIRRDELRAFGVE